METPSHNDLGPVWLNRRLFIINGAPMKFHLHGYNAIESQGMVRIIEAFGGKSSKPDAPDTFVFCEPGRSFGGDEYNCYNIQYFYDTIVALQPQNLMNYKLRISSNEQRWSVVDDHESMHLGSKEENNNKPEELSNFNYFRLRVTVDRRPSSPTDDDKVEKSYSNGESNHHDKENIIDDVPSTKYHDELIDSDTSWTARVPGVPPRKAEHCKDVDRLNKKRSPVLSQKQQINHRKVEEDKCKKPLQTTEDSNYTQAESNDIPVASSSSLTVRRNRMKMIFTDKDNEKMIGWVIKKNIIPQDWAQQIWRDMLKEKVLPNCNASPGDLSHHYREVLKNYPLFKKYMKDSSASQLSKRITLKPSTSMKINPRKTSFTEEENQMIIKWLIGKNVTPQDYARHIWRDMLKDKVLENRSVKPGVLSRHYREQLKHHPTFKKYMKHARVSRDNHQKKITFTEGDNQKIIKWVIQKNVIPQDYATVIWRDMLKDKVLRNCTASPAALSQHFREQLRQNPAFKKYIKNSTASRGLKEVMPKSYKPQNSNLRWSEKEDRILIQYLIDEDVINKAKGNQIWDNCLEVNKLSFAPTRTAQALCTRFYDQLRFCYAKYTDDPKVLRKFEDLGSTRRVYPQKETRRGNLKR